MGMTGFNFAGSNSSQFLGLVVAMAAFLPAGCQESASTNGTGNSPPAGGQAAPAASAVGNAKPQQETNAPQTADDVLKKMFEVYRECRSYRDTGVTAKAIQGPSVADEKTETFSTVFARPARYRFTKSWTNDEAAAGPVLD